MKTIQTVKEFNANATSVKMMFLNANGTPKKRGFVVTINDKNYLCETFERANNFRPFKIIF